MLFFFRYYNVYTNLFYYNFFFKNFYKNIYFIHFFFFNNYSFWFLNIKRHIGFNYLFFTKNFFLKHKSKYMLLSSNKFFFYKQFFFISQFYKSIIQLLNYMFKRYFYKIQKNQIVKTHYNNYLYLNNKNVDLFNSPFSKLVLFCFNKPIIKLLFFKKYIFNRRKKWIFLKFTLKLKTSLKIYVTLFPLTGLMKFLTWTILVFQIYNFKYQHCYNFFLKIGVKRTNLFSPFLQFLYYYLFHNFCIKKLILKKFFFRYKNFLGQKFFIIFGLKNKQNFTLKLLKNYLLKTKKLPIFIFNNIGVFLLSHLTLNFYRFNTVKSQFKKKIFSFLYPGEKKKYLFLKRKKKILTRLLLPLYKNTLNNTYSYNFFYKFFKILPNFYSTKNIFFSNITKTFSYFNSKLKTNFLYNEIPIINFFLDEIRISKIRFRPGYQRIWRQVRSTLQNSLNLKFQYQKRFTKYLLKFYKLTNQFLFSYSEATIIKIIIFSKLLPNENLVNFFLSKGFIYINNKINYFSKILVFKNDFIQFIVTLWYYIASRWFINLTLKRIKKFKRLVFKKNKPNKYKISKIKKQKSYYTPNWIYQVYYDDVDIKPYLEVDYFTLSLFMLTDIYIFTYYKPYDLIELQTSIYILYNWKYIT